MALLTASVWSEAAAADAIASDDPAAKPEVKIAVLATVYRPDSHADVIASKFIQGFPLADGTVVKPRVRIVSLWIDQPDASEYGVALAEEHGVPIYSTITEALTRGSNELAVDGVLFIGEHGDYPRSRFGAKMYPRLRILTQVFTVFEASNRVVPIFIDKQLSHNWHDAKWIIVRAAELNVPLMAGSTLPVARRMPELEYPIGERISEAVAVGYGPIDSYGFHILEMLQCMLERREGGETGVAAVQCLRGLAVYEAAERGVFSMELVEAATQGMARAKRGRIQDNEPDPIAIIVTYRDGTKGVALSMGQHVRNSWGYAARLDGGQVVHTEFQLDHASDQYRHFTYLGLNVQQMFLTGQPQMPVARTLLTSGLLDAALRSLHEDGASRDTPHLNVQYQPFDIAPIRMPTVE